jgi:hypothetical protein
MRKGLQDDLSYFSTFYFLFSTLFWVTVTAAYSEIFFAEGDKKPSSLPTNNYQLDRRAFRLHRPVRLPEQGTSH